MRMPRLLPLVAIAAGGVLAINLVENGPGIVGAARSFAEGVSSKAPASASPLPDGASAGPVADQAVAAKPAPICAESAAQLAKEAGLSPAELQVIQSLGARRGELDQREQGLSTELALIQAAEAKVDARIAAMNALKGDMQTLVGQLDDKQQAEVDRLVKVYETMINSKAQDAADRFVLLSDQVRLPIAAKMKERLLSAMIAKMPPPEAKRLTESLAARYVAQANAARQAINPPAAQAAAPPPPAPTQQPQAEAAQTAPPPAVTPLTKPPTPAVHRKPKKAKAPAKTIAAAPPEPVWPPKPGATFTPPGKTASAPPPAGKAAAAPPPPAKTASVTLPPAKTVSAPAAPPPAKSG
jgi:flagellar motility protein MotE (MotC chaperone)